MPIPMLELLSTTTELVIEFSLSNFDKYPAVPVPTISGSPLTSPETIAISDSKKFPVEIKFPLISSTTAPVEIKLAATVSMFVVNV